MSFLVHLFWCNQKFFTLISFSPKCQYKMELTNSLETITLNEQTNYRLMEIGKIKDYFNQEIKHQ